MRDSRSGAGAGVIAASSVCLPSLAIVPSRFVRRAGPGGRGWAVCAKLYTVRLVGLHICLVLMARARGTGWMGCGGGGDAIGGRGSVGYVAGQETGVESGRVGGSCKCGKCCLDIKNTHYTSPKHPWQLP